MTKKFVILSLNVALNNGSVSDNVTHTSVFLLVTVCQSVGHSVTCVGQVYWESVFLSLCMFVHPHIYSSLPVLIFFFYFTFF